jgi:deazaflavin-dependent oxidoreductase (nitroreductase family)
MQALVMVLLAAVGAAAAEEPPLPEVSAALARVAGASTIELTTTGRKSGKPHTKPIWFVVDGGKLVVQAGKDGKTDWYQNLAQSPTATVRQGDYTFRVRAKRVEDSARVEAIHGLFQKKYTSAWLLSFVGSSIGRGRPVELDPIAVSVQRGSSK